MMNHLKTVTAFAPATSANVAVGFDILGFAVEGVGDSVTLTKSKEPHLTIESINGSKLIPYDCEKNTATVALQAMLGFLDSRQGFSLILNKQIPISSGIGGSAASSVAAVVALNHFLLNPLPPEQLIEFALHGEKVACGVMHGDNVVPCLYGGMTLIQSLYPLNIIKLPVVPLQVVLIHPHLLLPTRESRAVLNETVDLATFVKQNARMAAFISGLYEENYDRMESACIDDVIEPKRAHLIPGFYDVKSAAHQYGAIACSISGSGPTMFAFAKEKSQALTIAKHMSLEFKKKGIESDSFMTTISNQGAIVIDEK
ncbi:homoserine kinase [Legionella waltersii]|uniref:Homoserine kinase n=1 Tax=Legionella waltersii TaxID=66969 RepID=A0A0W1AMN9_9GAMM|nr:homoserine kinase [Legionella waltersii]KTD82593.1 Homoserine kinase [Legionella waltersii]SNV02630.1 Homoserine kinase [Legionella waltersii]